MHGISARPAGPEPVRPSATIADDGQYRATFKNGASIEVVCISTLPTGPKTWWKPDGSPLAQPPGDTIEPSFNPGENATSRVFVVRVTGATKDSTYRWGSKDWTGYSGGKLRALAQQGLHVPLDDMGLVESIHLTAFHWVVGDLYRRISL